MKQPRIAIEAGGETEVTKIPAQSMTVTQPSPEWKIAVTAPQNIVNKIVTDTVADTEQTEISVNSSAPVELEEIRSKVEDVVMPATIARLILTSGIRNREPVDDLGTKIDGNIEQSIYIFSEILDMEGQQLTHRWLLNGREVAKINLAIGGIRWRTYSRKIITPEMVGQWQIELLNSDGDLLTSHKFDYYH